MASVTLSVLFLLLASVLSLSTVCAWSKPPDTMATASTVELNKFFIMLTPIIDFSFNKKDQIEKLQSLPLNI
jgi:hypothetical protein